MMATLQSGVHSSGSFWQSFWFAVAVTALASTSEAAPEPDIGAATGKTRDSASPSNEADTRRGARAEVVGAAVRATSRPRSSVGEKSHSPESIGVQYRVFGYVRIEGSVIQNDPNVAFVGRNDGFSLQNARFGIEGTWRQRVVLRLSADGADDQRSSSNATSGTLRFAIRDAYADIFLGAGATVRLARFKPFFELEEATSPRQFYFIDRALETRGVRATEGFEVSGLGVARDVGVALRSPVIDRSGAQLGYEISAVNGHGSLDSANDNDALAFSAAVFANVSNGRPQDSLPKEVFVFASTRYNRRTEGDAPARLDESDLAVAGGLRASAGALHLAGQILLRRTSFDTTELPYEISWGGHGQVVVDVPGPRGLSAGYRYALFDPSDLIASDRVQEHTLGATFLVESYRLRFQLNATRAVERQGRRLDNDRVEALAEVAL